MTLLSVRTTVKYKRRLLIMALGNGLREFDKIVVTNREDYDRTLANRKTLLDYSDGIY